MLFSFRKHLSVLEAIRTHFKLVCVITKDDLGARGDLHRIEAVTDVHANGVFADAEKAGHIIFAVDVAFIAAGKGGGENLVCHFLSVGFANAESECGDEKGSAQYGQRLQIPDGNKGFGPYRLIANRSVLRCET